MSSCPVVTISLAFSASLLLGSCVGPDAPSHDDTASEGQADTDTDTDVDCDADGDWIDIQKVKPNRGPMAGGTEVTISGDSGASFERYVYEIRFDGVEATILEFTTFSVAVEAPVASGPGVVDIEVLVDGWCGPGTIVLAEAYEYE